MSKTAKLKLSVNEAGLGKVSINDMDISQCLNGLEFKAVSGQLVEIKLTIFAEVDAEITARLDQIALAKKPAPPSPEAGIRFLKSRRAPD